MTTLNLPPLWRVMHSKAAPHSHPRLQTAAMIRAIADEMIMQFDPWLAEHVEVFEWLLSEADRTEKGE